jgi:hypothetical protein
MRIQPVLNRLDGASAGALRPAPVPDATAPVGDKPVTAPDDKDQPPPKRAEGVDELAPPPPTELVVPDGSK